MIVIGADTHKRTHTFAAVDAATGELLRRADGRRRRARDHAALLRWARGARRRAGVGDRGLPARVGRAWSGFWSARGERVVRVAPKLMAGARRGARERGKSDRIDALAVARAALREGVDALPAAHLDGAELEIRLLVDHRERPGRRALALSNAPALASARSLARARAARPARWTRRSWLARLARRLARRRADRRVRIARDELRRIRELTRADHGARARARRARRRRSRRELLAEPGCGPLTAAKLIGEIAGAERFATDAKLARAAGVAPIPAPPGSTRPPPPRPRRQPPAQPRAAPHRHHQRPLPPATPRLPRPQASPKARPAREALRCLKRHLARRVWHILRDAPPPTQPSTLT